MSFVGDFIGDVFGSITGAKQAGQRIIVLLFSRVRGLFTRKKHVPERLHGLFEWNQVHVLKFSGKEVAFYPPRHHSNLGWSTHKI